VALVARWLYYRGARTTRFCTIPIFQLANTPARISLFRLATFDFMRYFMRQVLTIANSLLMPPIVCEYNVFY